MLKDARAVYTPGLSERASGTSKFYHGDALGSTRGITNSSQTVTDAVLYDAFGVTVSRTGATATPFGFVGAQQYQSDADSGLQLLGHRMYDPSVGRFISSDPAKAGDNWVVYCNDDPLERVDPEGLDDALGDGNDLGKGPITRPTHPPPFTVPGNPPGPPGGPFQISGPIDGIGRYTIGDRPIVRGGGFGGQLDLWGPGYAIRLQGGESNSGRSGGGGSFAIGGRDGHFGFGGSASTVGGVTRGTIGGEFTVGNPGHGLSGSGSGTLGGIGGKTTFVWMLKAAVKF